MTFFENLLTVGILAGLGLIFYLKYTKQTLVDFIKALKEIFSESEEVQGGFYT